MGCNVVELGYMRSRWDALESDDVLVKDSQEGITAPTYDVDACRWPDPVGFATLAHTSTKAGQKSHL